MKKIYELEELSCPHCASVLASNLQKISFINEVHINYNTKQVEIISDKELTDSEVALVINTVITLSKCKTHEEALEIVEEFNFENIDCPHCALKVEEALNKEEDIIDAKVSFMNKKIIIKHKDNIEVFETVNRVLGKVEGDAYIYNQGCDSHHDHECDCGHDHHHHDHECDCGHEHHHHKHHKHCHCHDHVNNKLKFLDDIFKVTTGKIFNYILGITGFILFIATVVCKFTDQFSDYLMYGFIISYIMISYSLFVKAVKNIFRRSFFDENILMLVASIGALIVDEPIEAIMILVLYKIGDFLQAKAIRKSRDAIISLMDMHVDYVTMSNLEKVEIKDVLVGEEIIVKVGERIPLDGEVIEGTTELNMAMLTGESLPVVVKPGDKVMSGCINLSEVITVKVSTNDENSTITKVLKLVEEASSKKSHTEEFISKFAKVYTPIVIILALLVFLVPTIFIDSHNAYNYLHRACMFLVISCPCALIISIPLGFFGGIGLASKNGILVKGGNYLEALTKTKKIVFDKTGTITKGIFYVAEINPIKGLTKANLTKIVAHLESFSLHPIAKSIVEHHNDTIDKTKVKEVVELPGHGIKGIYEEKLLLVGKESLMKEYHIPFKAVKTTGTVIHIGYDGKYLGNIIIKDEIRSTSAKLINSLNKQGIETIMLTGDNLEVASEVAKVVGIKEYHASLLPAEKLEKLENIINNKNKKETVIFIGDGINDTPSLKLADVGIAMGGIGADSAKEASDIVIMNDDISKVLSSIKISKFTHRVVIQNIVFALVIKVLAMIIGGFDLLGSWGMYLAVVSDVGVCLITILNSLRILIKKVDKNKRV
jgi:Cd2+/Zn2+-exporting ATPase